MQGETFTLTGLYVPEQNYHGILLRDVIFVCWSFFLDKANVRLYWFAYWKM